MREGVSFNDADKLFLNSHQSGLHVNGYRLGCGCHLCTCPAALKTVKSRIDKGGDTCCLNTVIRSASRDLLDLSGDVFAFTAVDDMCRPQLHGQIQSRLDCVDPDYGGASAGFGRHHGTEPDTAASVDRYSRSGSRFQCIQHCPRACGYTASKGAQQSDINVAVDNYDIPLVRDGVFRKR